ncbi:GATA zinc finger domain-containing protein 1, partial [Bulinus truncatus]
MAADYTLDVDIKFQTNDGFVKMYSTQSLREKFYLNLIKTLRLRHVDGVKIDVQLHRGGNKVEFSKFIKLLGNALQIESSVSKLPKLTLSVGIPSEKSFLDEYYDIKQISDSADVIDISSYYFHAPYEVSKPEHHSPLYSTDVNSTKTIDFLSKYVVENGAEKNKINVGLSSMVVIYYRPNGVLYRIMKIDTMAITCYWRYNTSPKHRMEPGKGVYIGYVPYNNGYYNILVYDDEKSLTEKVNYIKKNGFSGVVLRSLNYDDYMSHCVPKFFPLLAAITDECRFKMPFGIKPICSSCKITSSPIWRKGLKGEVFCNSCGLKQLSGQYVGNNLNSKTDIVANGITNGSAKASNGSSAASGSNNNVPVLRKSLRIKPAKKTAQSSNKNLSTKGKGRRIIFKKNQPLKAPAAVATVITGECVFHK